VPRIVLPGLERVKRSKIWKDLPYVILIITVLLSMSIGVIYFHGINPEEAKNLQDKYNSSWFIRNNKSKPPPSIEDIMNPPKTNETPPIPPDIISKLNASYVNFVVEGEVPLLGWRLFSFDTYVRDSGWTFGEEDYRSYTGETNGDMVFRVFKPIVDIDGEGELDLVSLWSPIYGVEASDFAPYEPSLDEFVFSVRVSDLNERLYVYVSSSQSMSLGVEYLVYGSEISEDIIAGNSELVSNNRVYVYDHPELERFISIPNGYFAAYPEVESEFANIVISDDMTVFEAVSFALSYFTLNYEISFEPSETEGDPVAEFINNRGGSFLSFVYTVALALRWYDIPSRVIIGYLGGQYNESEDLTYLTASDLMMWIEVFDIGNGGWVPFNCLPININVLNLVETGLHFSVFIDAPRYVEGVPAVYLDENFSVVVVAEGPGAGYLSGEVYYSDYNESCVFGASPFIPIDAESSYSMYTTSYADIYGALGIDPNYGIHIIVIEYEHFRFYALVALLKRVSVSP